MNEAARTLLAEAKILEERRVELTAQAIEARVVDLLTFPPLKQQLGQQGAWICPRCETVNAWWVAHCRCKPEKTA